MENRHLINAAIVDQTGRLLGSLGDPSRLTLIRSAAKPAQTIAILEAISERCPAAYTDLTSAQIALMCASHSSEPRHVEVARQILDTVCAKEDDLACGGHPSISHKLAAEWARDGYKPTKINNNCSGKHAGMIAANIVLQVDNYPGAYALPSAPIQKRVRDVVSEFTGLGEEEVKWAVDGCALPAPAIPLESMGSMFAMVAACAEESLGETPNDIPIPISPKRRSFATRLWRSIAAEPLYIAGEGRFCSLLAKLGAGKMFGKVGADGCYGIAIRPCAQTESMGAQGSVGIAIKVEDGNQEVLYMAVTEILLQLGFLREDNIDIFGEFHGKKRLNTADEIIGGWEFEFDIREAITDRKERVGA